MLYNLLGERVGAIQTIRDLTQRRETKEELKRSYAEMDQRVQERMEDLARANAALQHEIKRCNAIEVNLRRQESLYLTIAESFNDFICVINRESRLQYVNPYMAKRIGLRKGNVVPHRGQDPFLKSFTKQLSLLVDVVFETGEKVHKELTADSPSGKMVLDTLLAPFTDKGGRN
ncbi:MAG: PAS domain S-box protein [Methanomicrobiales archaeon]|nr:PAS domain S-box protein [Methanomicrobiales archaeon]